MRTEALAPRFAAAAALGALYTLAFVHTAAWALQLACIGLLAWLVRDVRPRGAAVLGWAFGFAWLAAGTWWLFVSMHRYGDLPAPLAALAVAALAGALALYLAAALALFARGRSGRWLPDALLFGAVWLLAELARAVLFTGFPWVATGYGQVDAPLAALAPWVGVYGVGAVVAVLAALLGLARTPARQLAAAAAVAIALLAAPFAARDFGRSAGTVGVTLLQTNVPQQEKFDPERLPQALERLAIAIERARGPLVIAPETAIPLLPDQLGAAAWQRLAGPFRDGPRALLVGLPLGSYEAGYTNSVAGLAAGAPEPFYRYDKHHLVPFGEFIPPGFRWFTEAMNIPLGDFARGPAVPPSFAFAGQRVAPNICYEDLFGEELARRFADDATAPTLLANVSNIAWFGDTIALPQHLAISRFRSLELQRPMVRATNSGVTAAIDHRGVVQARLPAFERGVLQVEVEGRHGRTPFARWVAGFGLWPLLAAALALVALCGRWRAKAAP
jgi:apolipoprotein N-acyltransferase